MSLATTARGGGYFVVYASPIVIPKDVIDGPAWLKQNAMRIDQHTQEREAMVTCSEILEAVKNGAPVVHPYYTHELCVRVVETVVQENVGVPLPPVIPETIPEGSAVDFIEMMDKLLPEGGDEYVIQTNNFWAAVELFMDRCKTTWLIKRFKQVIYEGNFVDLDTAKRKWIGFGWRGGIVLWHEMNIRFLVQSVAPVLLACLLMRFF